MKEVLMVFAAQYVYICLLGVQSLNVNQRQYVMAAITSFLLGTLGFFLTSVIGSARNMEFSVLWWSFVISGPCGIVTAMLVHPWMVKTFGGEK